MLTKGGVLLVEGDPCLRESMVAALVAEHYEVFLASTGPQAAQLAQAAPIDVLVVDLTGQSLGHWDLFVDLAVAQPHLRTVVFNGGRDRQTTVHPAGGYAILGTPLDLAQLVETINGLLAERRTETLSSRLLPHHDAAPASLQHYHRWGLNE